MEQKIEIVGEKILYEHGSFRRVQRWIKGWHPKLGVLLFGLTGPETMIETDSIRPMRTFYVEEVSPPSQADPPAQSVEIPPPSLAA